MTNDELRNSIFNKKSECSDPMVLNCIHSVVGAASSRDEPRQRETDAIFVAESRSHEVKIIIVQ